MNLNNSDVSLYLYGVQDMKLSEKTVLALSLIALIAIGLITSRYCDVDLSFDSGKVNAHFMAYESVK